MMFTLQRASDRLSAPKRVIEINSIEELIALMEEEQEEVIIGWNLSKASPNIEYDITIYDARVE